MIINPYRFGSATYDTDAQAYFDEVVSRGGSVADALKQKISDGVAYLKGTGDWDLIDRLFLLKNTSAIAALTSIKNPTSTAATVVNSPTFTADVGYAFNGSTQYLNTQYIPSTDGVNWVLNSAWMARGIASNADGVYVDMGASDNTKQCIIEDPTSSVFYFGMNQGIEFDTGSVSTTDSHTHVKRTASGDVDGFKGATQYNGTKSSSTVVNKKIYLAAWNQNDSAVFFKPCTMTWCGMGGAVDTAEINTAFDTYFL